MSDIWAFLTKDAGPDDWYTAEIRLRRRGGGGPSAVLRVDSRTAALATRDADYADLDNHVRAFKRIVSGETGQ